VTFKEDCLVQSPACRHLYFVSLWRCTKIIFRVFRKKFLWPSAVLRACFFIQGEHKVVPLLQTFIKRKLHGIQTYFFYHYLRFFLKFYVMSCFEKKYDFCNRGKTLRSPCICVAKHCQVFYFLLLYGSFFQIGYLYND